MIDIENMTLRYIFFNLVKLSWYDVWFKYI